MPERCRDAVGVGRGGVAVDPGAVITGTVRLGLRVGDDTTGFRGRHALVRLRM